MLALAPRQTARFSQKDRPMNPHENAVGDHFTPADRRELIQTGERLAGLKEDFAELKRTIEIGNTRQAADVGKLELEMKSELRRVELELRAEIKDLDTRERLLENFRYWILGAAAGIGAVAGYLGAKFHV